MTVYSSPTLRLVEYRQGALPEGILERPEIAYVPPEVRERWREMERRIRTVPLMAVRIGTIDLFFRIVGELQDAGVGLLAGSDADLTYVPFVVPGFGLHDELIALVDAGLTPLEALQTATLYPARFVGRNDELGTVEPGKLADLVLLNANPLEDIRNTQRIGAVVASGRLYRRSDLDRLLAEVEASVQQGQKQE